MILRIVLVIVVILASYACQSTPGGSSASGQDADTPAAAAALVERARQQTPTAATPLLLSAADIYLSYNQVQSAVEALNLVDPARLRGSQPGMFAWMNAWSAWTMGDVITAANHLPNISRWEEPQYRLRAAVCAELKGYVCAANALISAAQEAPEPHRQAPDPSMSVGDAEAQPATPGLQPSARSGLQTTPQLTKTQLTHDQIWLLLTRAAGAEPPAVYDSAIHAGWWQLAGSLIATKTVSDERSAWDTWQRQHADHPATITPPQTITRLARWQPPEIAALLPLSGALAGAGTSVRDGMVAAWLIMGARPAGAGPDSSQPGGIRFYDTNTASIGVLYEQALTDGADIIVGPLTKDKAAGLASLRPSLTTLLLNYLEDEAPPAQTMAGSSRHLAQGAGPITQAERRSTLSIQQAPGEAGRFPETPDMPPRLQESRIPPGLPGGEPQPDASLAASGLQPLLPAGGIRGGIRGGIEVFYDYRYRPADRSPEPLAAGVDQNGMDRADPFNSTFNSNNGTLPAPGARTSPGPGFASENGIAKPANVFQLGLAIEDEATTLANYLIDSGSARVLVIGNSSDWANRARTQFRKQWPFAIADHSFDNIKTITESVGQAMSVADSRTRHRELADILGETPEFQPRARRDLDAVVAFVTDMEAQALKPALRFHYADHLPLHTSSQALRGATPARMLNGAKVAELPFFVDGNPLYRETRAAFVMQRNPFAELYALGIDAWQLGQRIALLEPNSARLYAGATGRLSLNGAGAFHRTLTIAEIQAGRLVAVSVPDTAGIPSASPSSSQGQPF